MIINIDEAIESLSRVSMMKRRYGSPIRWVGRAWAGMRNWRRKRHDDLDYIVITLAGTIPALPEARSWWERRLFGQAPLTLWEIDQAFRQIAADSRPKGVIVMLRDPALSLADVQSVRGMIARLRAAGKRAIAYAQNYDLGSYLIASACDEILMQPGGDVATLGIFQQTVFLKNALDAVGVALDVIAITPYKGAYDPFSRDSLSPEAREQQEWLLDSRYRMIVRDLARSRGWDEARVTDMIDHAPHLDTIALERGYIDGLLYQEAFPAHLDSQHLIEWDDARRKLIRPYHPHETQKHIAILPITGLMLPGESAAAPFDVPIPLPFIGGQTAGDITIVQQVRALMKEERVGAVVLFIDSGGGAAVAADAMTSALDQLARHVPVVAYMNGVAASGGYMVACPARWIVAQPGTITGSIGVITAKPITGGLEEKLLFKTVSFLRGANADLYSSSTPFTEPQRAQIRAAIEHNYRQFIERVAVSRDMTPESVDAIGGGRVWTGEQAIEHALIDELGDLRAAIDKARALAGLPERTRIVIDTPRKDEYLPPMAARAADPAAAVRALLRSARGLFDGRPLTLLPFDERGHW